MARSKTPDQLAKALHPYLSSKTSPSELKSLGWFDFLNQDRPMRQLVRPFSCRTEFSPQ